MPHLCWGSKVSNVGFAQRHEHKHKHKLNGCEDVHNAQCKHKDKQYNHLCSSCAYAYVKLESAAVSISISPPSCISISRRCGLENRQLSILYICACSVMLVLWVSSLPCVVVGFNVNARCKELYRSVLFFQELKKQVETVIEREKKLKSELKKKENDLKSELENSKVCSASKVSL